MYKSLTDMVDDNAGMMDLSQYFRLGKIFHIKLVTTMMRWTHNNVEFITMIAVLH